jgi:GT2 family glycosyltransferase
VVGADMAKADILIPTCNRPTGLAVVLASLNAQSFTDFDVVISDQSDDDIRVLDRPEIRTLVTALRIRGHRVEVHRHMPRRGMAEQRHFLLERSRAPYVHYLDDDVLLDSSTLRRMHDVMEEERCGFVGAAATGLDFINDRRPHQWTIEVWNGPVKPEPFGPGSIPLERHVVNNAANPLHLEQQLVMKGETVRYKVAWIGGANVLYDREKLLNVGGFRFWDRLPAAHAGEEVVVQFLLIRRHGGCGILPAGTYHLGLPTTVPDRTTNATALFAALVAEQEGSSSATPRSGSLSSSAKSDPLAGIDEFEAVETAN